MLINQTTIDAQAMTALAKITRKTLRRGRNGPVRMLAWFVVILELFLTVVYIRGGASGWLINLLLGLFMLGSLLSEDHVNGRLNLRRVLPTNRAINTTFQERTYIHRTQSGESGWPYSQIQAIAEDANYFALLLDRNHGQIYDKAGFSWGTPDEFREFIQRKTGLKMLKVR